MEMEKEEMKNLMEMEKEERKNLMEMEKEERGGSSRDKSCWTWLFVFCVVESTVLVWDDDIFIAEPG